MTPPAVEVEDLVIAYGDKIAVEALSLTVQAGTVTAIIGAPYFLYLLMGKQRHDG